MAQTWKKIVEADPEHSRRYARRWDDMIAEGVDIDGEARLADAMAPRGARVLDVGCGQGRMGVYLHARGHRVTGVDIDPYLVDRAREQCPDATWEVADLAVDGWAAGPFDLAVSAGNVLAFVDPADRGAVLSNLADRLAPASESTDGQPGRLVVGFGLDRGWTREEFDLDAERAGLRVEQRWSTWDLRPFDDDSGFMVAVLVRA
ncbi:MULTISPECIES: class I SAM-dependent DNA methyltransferase [Dietzia]|uniref:Class I SAM-dependent methyltransferase n=1 Tax=Dietzia cinnamea TaxID=321318 RepID=A0AAW5Q876_9ACTN|nr:MULTISPECIES: class I SAM-dependent methyltransferase [Dietzia]KZO57900.1 SAM-dependent methyltransferase [Dietzia maris]MBM7230580.1 class I SAM-dependent methyltransferase [Dietzia cinnamea]MCT1863734.1 class I SAM-dependent methyltransferase [Dietzia cinnamea]MCT2029444.1 class I SAM-dependent methyltransferase [Dietzia cinnamea]MCT2032158.1 class I SAM-dependent methyltransferase [Dietzia cinnamea]